jgi:hypothetical protein
MLKEFYTVTILLWRLVVWEAVIVNKNVDLMFIPMGIRTCRISCRDVADTRDRGDSLQPL